MSEEQLTQSDLPEWLEQVTGDDTPTRVRQKLSPMAVALILVAAGLLAIIGFALHERNKGDLSSGPAPAFNVTIWNFDRVAMAGQPVSLSANHSTLFLSHSLPPQKAYPDTTPFSSWQQQ